MDYTNYSIYMITNVYEIGWLQILYNEIENMVIVIYEFNIATCKLWIFCGLLAQPTWSLMSTQNLVVTCPYICETYIYWLFSLGD